MDKIKLKVFNLIKSTAGKISIVLTILFLTTLFVGLLLGVKDANPICERFIAFLLGLSGNILGLILTVNFIQRLMDSAKDKNKRQTENKKILRYHRIMELYLSQYKHYFCMIITPIEEQRTIKFDDLKQTFEFKDLHHLHRFSFFEGDPTFGETRISLFYKAEKAMVDFLKKMIEEINFNYNSSLYSVINNFLVCSIRLDVSAGILQNERLFTGPDNDKRAMSNVIEEYIKEDEKHNWVSILNDPNRSANIMGPYVTLFQLLKIERQYIIEYESEIDRIKKCTNIEE